MSNVQTVLQQAREQLAKYSRDNPLLNDLPPWVGHFRPHQRDACDDILDGLNRCNLVILDAPTGSGKTLIAETIRRLGKFNRSLYVCNSKSLQHQFIGDFPDAKLLQGRNNYATERYPERFASNNPAIQLNCSDCNKSPERGCDWCVGVDSCPYEQAKRSALRAECAVLNTSYYLTECNGPGRFSGRELVVFDECDTLERELMSYVSVEITEGRARRLGIKPPSKVTVKETWVDWCDRVIPIIERHRAGLRPDGQDVKTIREGKYLTNLLKSVRQVRAGMVSDDGGYNESSKWVYTGRDNHISFKPSEVREIAGQLLWRHGGKFLLMSGSVVSSEQLINDLGWEGNYETVRVPSTFPPQNRKVYIRPVSDMSRSKDEKGQLYDGITNIVREHPHERVLLHTVSYQLSEGVSRHIESLGTGRELWNYSESRDKQSAIGHFLNSEAGIIVAPSLDRGIDLPDGACRVIVICKVPFPYLGDRQVSARLYSPGGQLWYSVQTARTLIQMTGRGVRHSKDYCTSYVLDKQFVGFYKKNKYLFPNWWIEGLEWRM